MPKVSIATAPRVQLEGPVHERAAVLDVAFQQTVDAYYTPPGHIPVVEEGCELLMFSPAEELAATNAAIERGMAALQG